MMFGGRSAVYPQADTPTTCQVFGTDYRLNAIGGIEWKNTMAGRATKKYQTVGI